MNLLLTFVLVDHTGALTEEVLLLHLLDIPQGRHNFTHCSIQERVGQTTQQVIRKSLLQLPERPTNTPVYVNENEESRKTKVV